MNRATIKTRKTLRLVRSPRARYRLTAEPPIDTPAGKGQRPTSRAVRMANALVLEHLLHEGVFQNLGDAMAQLGISRGIVQRLLQMLNQPPAKMVEILNSRY